MPARGQPLAGRPPASELSLPPNFTEIRAILDGQLSPGSMVNVVGLVIDFRLPTATKGAGESSSLRPNLLSLTVADFKCTLILKDLSVEDNDMNHLEFNIFRPRADMPQVTAADVVLVTQAKVQNFRSNMSLIAHSTTSIRRYAASKIPRPPHPAQAALEPGPKRDSHAPTPEEHRYVSYFYHKICKDDVPDEHTFKARAAQSLNVKDKFSELKDVRDGKFYDLVGQVAKEPYDAGWGGVTLYISDYTENSNFFHKTWDGLEESGSGSGDPYGYTTSTDLSMHRKEWVGPYGKMTIQITCFEPHASIIRSEVRSGSWVQLRNVQIKYGRDGRFLEGFMRENRDAITKTNVDVLETTNRDTIDPRLLKAIGRCRDYHKKKKQQIKQIKSAEAAGQKRKASLSLEQSTRPLTSRERRSSKRAARGRRGEEERHASEEKRLELNDQVECEVHPTPFATIESILEPKLYETTVDNQRTSLVLPFNCVKYRCRARVVDFFPPTLEDFACSRKSTLYDVLSDDGNDSGSNSGASSTSSSGDDVARGGQRVWEWRFALQLEDPGPAGPAKQQNKNKPGPRPRLWVLVDNIEAQCLTGLDATDLRRDGETLALLRKCMAVLWGDLEERKARAAARRREKGADEEAAGGMDMGKQRRQQLLQKPPPLESSDAEDDAAGDEPVSNKPFSCCIRQYGVYDKTRPGGGEWVRCFGLFGTKICFF